MKDPVLKSIFGLGSSPDGIGQSYATEKVSGPGSGLEHRSPVNVGRGIGQSDTIGITVTRMALAGGAGAIIGVALAPSDDKVTKYGIIGGLLGLFLGPLGMAGQALYVISKR